MKQLKRLVSAALIFMLCLSISPISVFAQIASETTSHFGAASESSDYVQSAYAQQASATSLYAPNEWQASPSSTPQPFAKAAWTASPTSPVAVEPELFKVVKKPLVSVTYHYYDIYDDKSMSGGLVDFSDYNIASSHTFYAIARMDGERISFAANKHPSRIAPSTHASRFRVLRGGEDITALAQYSAATGMLSLPAMYMGHEIAVEWFCPESEIVELPVRITTSIFKNGTFTVSAKEALIAFNANTFSIPISVGTGLVVSQNGLDLDSGQYSVKDGILNIAASALGGDITISAYADARQSRGTSLTSVSHGRSADQIYYGYYTSYYTANGNAAFCLDPNASGLNPGNYGISSYLQRGRDDTLIKMAYYLYGGPGYDSVKNRLFTGNADSLQAYALCHAAASYVYLNDDSAFRRRS